MSNKVRRNEILCGLIGVFIIEFFLRNLWLPDREHVTSGFLRMALIIEWLLLAIVALWWVPKMEKQGIGFGFTRFRLRYAGLGLLAFVAVMAVSIIYGLAASALGLQTLRELQPFLKGLSPDVLILLFFTGMIFEEAIYRGYLMERIQFLTGSQFKAGIISWILFVTVHYKFFGLGPMLEGGILSAALVILYVREQSIWPCIVLHGTNNFVGYILFPLLLSGV